MLPLTIYTLLTFYSIACLGFGWLLWRLLGGSLSTPPGGYPVSALLGTFFLLGQGALAAWWALWALTGAFTPLLVLLTVGLAFLTGLGTLFWTRGEWLPHLAAVWKDHRADTWTWKIVTLLVVVTYVGGLGCVGRPLFDDAKAFYMALPKVIAASHRLVPLPGYEDFTQIGLQGELHFAALMVLGSPDAAKMFTWVTGLAVGLMLWALNLDFGLQRRGRWLVQAMVVTSSAVVLLWGDGKVDLIAAGMGLAAFYWALKIGSSGPLAFRLTGLLTGWTLVAKLSYLQMLPALGLVILWRFWRSEDNAGELRDISGWRSYLFPVFTSGLRLSAWMTLALLPHFIKNYLLYGQPFLPFGASSTGWLDQTWFNPDTTRRILLTYPLALVYGQYAMQYGNLSPLTLGLAPLLLFVPRPQKWLTSPLVVVTGAALTGLVAYALLRPSVMAPRYFLATLLLLFPAVAKGAEHIVQNKKHYPALARGVEIMVLIILISSFMIYLRPVFSPASTSDYFWGHQDECGRDGSACRAMVKVNQEARPGDRVLLWTYTRYWLRPDLLQCLSAAKDQVCYQQETLENKWKCLFERGFRYIIMDRDTHGGMEKSLSVASPPAGVRLTKVFDQDSMVVWRADYDWPLKDVQVWCRETEPPAWSPVTKK